VAGRVLALRTGPRAIPSVTARYFGAELPCEAPDDDVGPADVVGLDDDEPVLDVPDDPFCPLDILDEPLGLLDMLDVPLELPGVPLDASAACDTPSADSVCASSSPVCGSPCACWNCFSAPSVWGPALPSALPAS